MTETYHIEYDLPIDHEGHPLAIFEQLAGHIEYIMDDIIHDIGMERYQLIFYYLVNKVILDRIISLESTRNGE